MDYQDSNKRFKSSNGTAVPAARSPVANLPAYQPPPPITAAGSARGSSSVSGSPTAPPTRPSASIDRSANGNKLRLTVKAPPSKLRQATSSSNIPPNPYATAQDGGVSGSDATPAPATRTARSTRNARAVIEPESEEAEEDAEGDEDEEMEGEDEVDQELRDMEGSEEDAEGEEDEDEPMDDHPPPPVITQTNSSKPGKPSVKVTAPPEGPLKSVEAKEMDDDDDEELSELEEDLGGDEVENENDEEDEELDSDDEDSASKSATPDLSKLTRRQRGLYEEEADTGLMALSNEAQKKKHLTAEEHAMRRQEMARRRKNLSEKRNEEEKMDTINKLLKKPAPKRRTRAEIIAAQHAEDMATPGAEDGEEERPDPLFTRYVSTVNGSRLGVPEEWLEGPVGDWMNARGTGDGANSGRMGGGRMVEEVA